MPWSRDDCFACAFDLSQSNAEVTIADIDESKGRVVVDRIGSENIKFEKVDATDKALKNLGGNHEIVEKELTLSREARENGITIIPDCDLAVGLINEYTAKVRVMRDGVIVELEPLTEIEFEEPFGRMVAFSTSGS